MTYLAAQCFNLTYLDRFNIEYLEHGLDEPSGLALSHRHNALWTVSDDTNKIFKLSLKGKLKKAESFEIPDKGLEGITLDPSGAYLFTVKEDGNEIIQIQVDTQGVVNRRRLSNMSGYNSIAHYFEDSDANKGLEGIAWNNETDTVFVVKEGGPGLLIEVSSDLNEILSHQLLDYENGFRDDDVSREKLDLSDLSYDPHRNQFWIISDKARRLFLYDWKRNKVTQSAKLAYPKNGKYREIKKAEGVAIDTNTNRLYVVSDEEARLYVFELRD